MKDRLGRVAYLYTGARNLSARRVKATVDVDGEHFFEGRASCVLAGNVGKVIGGIQAFAGARPDDGLLELGVVTARNPAEWARALGWLAVGNAVPHVPGRAPSNGHPGQPHLRRTLADRDLGADQAERGRPAAAAPPGGG